jgi:hypothetical protein
MREMKTPFVVVHTGGLGLLCATLLYGKSFLFFGDLVQAKPVGPNVPLP